MGRRRGCQQPNVSCRPRRRRPNRPARRAERPGWGTPFLTPPDPPGLRHARRVPLRRPGRPLRPLLRAADGRPTRPVLLPLGRRPGHGRRTADATWSTRVRGPARDRPVPRHVPLGPHRSPARRRPHGRSGPRDRRFRGRLRPLPLARRDPARARGRDPAPLRVPTAHRPGGVVPAHPLALRPRVAGPRATIGALRPRDGPARRAEGAPPRRDHARPARRPASGRGPPTGSTTPSHGSRPTTTASTSRPSSTSQRATA